MELRRVPVLLAVFLTALLAVASARGDEADDQFALAAGHYARQRWKLAIEEFHRFLTDFPDHPKANQCIYQLAEAQVQLGHADEAIKNLRLYLERDPTGGFARQALFRLGETEYLSGQHDEAQKHLEQFKQAHADDKLGAYVLPYLGNIASAKGDAAAAEKLFRDALARFPAGRLQDDCRVGLARSLEKLNQREEAERLYAAVAAKTGSVLAGEAQFRLGALQYTLGKYDQAVESFAAFDVRLAQSDWKSRSRIGRGWALWKLGRLDEAKQSFQSVSADPKIGIEARYWLGLTEKVQGQWQAAAKTLLDAAAVDPKHELAPALIFHAGEALAKAGDAAGAVQQFDRVIASASQGNEWIDHAWRGKIQTALQAGDHATVDRLIAEFDQRLPASPLAKDVRRLQARSLLERKNYEAAAKLLESLSVGVAKNEQSLEDRYLLAVAYEGLKRYDESLALALPVVDAAKGPLKTDAQLLQGSLLIAKRRYQEAIAPLEAFASSKPAGDAAVKVQGELAICYARTGQFAKAKQLYAGLTEKFPKHPLLVPTAEQLAEAAYEAKDWEWSGQLSGQLRTGGGSSDTELKGLSVLGWSQFKAGKMAEAAATFEQVLAKNPPAALASEVALVRGQALEQLNQPEAALAMYDLIIDKHPTAAQHADALLAAARLRDKLRQGPQAAALYERLAKEYRQHPRRDVALYEWAWVLQDLDKGDEAAAAFESVRKEYPESRFAPDATYRLAQRAFLTKQYDQAKKLTAEVLAGKAEPEVREYARYLNGQIAVAEQKWDEVRSTFETLVKDFPGSRQRLAAEFWIAETYYRKGEYEEAGRRFDELARQIQGRRETWLGMIPLRRAQVLAQKKKWQEAYDIAVKIETQYPKFEQQYEVDYLLGRCLHDRAELQAARTAFERVIKSPQGAKTETAAMAQWMIGETYFHQKDYGAAIREYARLEYGYDYPTWQAAAALQSGKCHDLREERKEAERCYARVIKDYPDTQFAAEAAERLKNPAESPAKKDL
jgi:cellulose synthase operon protein C